MRRVKVTLGEDLISHYTTFMFLFAPVSRSMGAGPADLNKTDTEQSWSPMCSKYTCILSHSVMQLCDPMQCRRLGSTLHEIFQARYWNEFLFLLRGSSPLPGIKPTSLKSLAFSDGFFTMPHGKIYIHIYK